MSTNSLTKIHLTNHFRELREVHGWDVEINGNSYHVIFTTANLNVKNEITALGFLLGLTVTEKENFDSTKWVISMFSNDPRSTVYFTQGNLN